MFIATSQIAAQQYLLRMVPRGYHWWTSGVCSRADLELRSKKYDEHYGASLNRAQCSYRKLKGLANSKLVAVELVSGEFLWFLLATDGLGPIRDNTKLLDARTNNGRIKWGSEYVLFEAKRLKIHGGGTHWSWFFQPKTQSEIQHYIGVLIKEEPENMRFFIEQLCRRPMHSGVRSFIGKTIRLAAKNWAAVHPGRPWSARDPMKPLPILDSFRPSQQQSG